MIPLARTYPAAGPVTLAANIHSYPPSRALVEGRVPSDLVELEFAGFKTAHAGFKPMLREARYDISEMAIATFLQAHEFGKPFTLLPICLLGRFQHHAIGYNEAVNPGMTPADLPGRVVGVRSYTQTTGLWVRGVLQNDFGVDLDAVTWLCQDHPHLAEYRDPPSVRFATDTVDMAQMLLEGEIDAAILGMNLPKDPRIKPLIADPHAAAQAWYGRSGFVPANHYVIVPDALCDERPDVVRELWRMLVESRNAAEATEGPSAWSVGIEANRKVLQAAITYATQQHFLQRPVRVDDLFSPLIRDIAP